MEWYRLFLPSGGRAPGACDGAACPPGEQKSVPDIYEGTQDRCILLLFFRASGSDGFRIGFEAGEKQKILIVKNKLPGEKPTAPDSRLNLFQ